MACAVVTDETLGIEYDEETVCDVCRDVCFTQNSSPLFSSFCFPGHFYFSFVLLCPSPLLFPFLPTIPTRNLFRWYPLIQAQMGQKKVINEVSFHYIEKVSLLDIGQVSSFEWCP